MEDFERKLRRAAVKRRAQNTSTFKTVCAPIDAARKQKRVTVRRKKLESLGIKTKVCSICGSDDVSTFEFDHFAGNKHHDQEWPLCETCHQERNPMQREEPPPSDNPRNPFEVIGRWLLSMAEYFEMLVRHLRKFGEFLIGLAKQGYGAEFELPT
jgi:hypothetical protein